MLNCRVYRASLLLRQGKWDEAVGELERTARELANGHGALVAGHAYYELGEVHRLRGDADQAEGAFRRAAGLGATPQPGLALLRLARGDVATAAAGLRRALAESERALVRCRLLPAYVTAMLAAGAVDEAQESVDELQRAAAAASTSTLTAVADHAFAELALGRGNPEAALPALRRSADVWRRLGAPYDLAKDLLLLGSACRALGDEEAAQMEFEAAREILRRLGAQPDLDEVSRLLRPASPPHGLSPREIEVLRLVAAGRTNRAIAAALFLSERTVHRHVSNIFEKLGVASRTEAAAFAAEHDLLSTARGT
jgi:DNA-binding CsgD family transcriptional regulator